MTLDHTSQPSSQKSTPAQQPASVPAHSTSLPPIEPAIQPLKWLWPGRIPQGKLTLLDGSPGCGTTLFAVTLAAHVSRGRPFPDGTPCIQGGVLFIASHDNFRDTLLPRLAAAGAHDGYVMSLSQVFDDPPASEAAPIHSSHPFSLAHDLPFLEQTIIQMGIVLLIIDPYTTLPGWRKALPALVGLAQRTHCAIVLTRSLNRAPSDPLHPRCPASTALTTARSHLLLAPDPRDERHCLLLTPKHSLCAAPPILAYSITTHHDQPLLCWLPLPDPTELRRLCTGPIRSPHRLAILRFLRECPNPCHIKDILAATCYDYEAGRKMLVRMKMAGELVSLDRGLYTTANHPCLAHINNNSQSDSSASPVSDVPGNSSSPVAPGNPETEVFKRMIATGQEAFAELQARLTASGYPMPTIPIINVPSPNSSQNSEITNVPNVPAVPDQS